MRRKLKFLWHHHRIAFLAFLTAALVTLFFIIRMTMFTIYWSAPEHRNQPPEPWMTPRYIAFSWGLEPADIATALNVTAAFGKRPSLQRVADARGVPVSDILSEVAALLQSASDSAQDATK